ncbi:MAG TPA: 3-oxoacyl-[acyl-carrier-protein] synthase III C-terminal domain-containing protein [Deltaproteobacteria bacterium]|nr:3-oxoacyl-[acyl-carrier-protein] synthase III C-terminal domain-containing protein [Deltaproteobacteria bacterium]
MRCRIESVGAAMRPRSRVNGEGSVDPAVEAARACLSTSSHPVYNISYLVNAKTRHPSHVFEPANAVSIQDSLDMNTGVGGKGTFSFDLMNGASGGLTGIKVIISAIKGGAARVGMMIAGDMNTNMEVANMNMGMNACSASGSAVIVDISPNPDKGFGSFLFKTFDIYSDLPCRYLDVDNESRKTCGWENDELEEIYVECAAITYEKLLKKERILSTYNAVDFVFATQISPNFMVRLARGLGLPEEMVIDVTGILNGVTLTSSPFIAFDYAMRNNMIKPGMKAAFITVGQGITVGCAMYYC